MKSISLPVIKAILQQSPERDAQAVGTGSGERVAEAPWKKEKPPVLGMIQRGGEVVIQMRLNVQ